jgi:hypothetical protein
MVVEIRKVKPDSAVLLCVLCGSKERSEKGLSPISLLII